MNVYVNFIVSDPDSVGSVEPDSASGSRKAKVIPKNGKNEAFSGQVQKSGLSV